MASAQDWAENKTQRLIRAAQKDEGTGPLLNEVAAISREFERLSDDDAGKYMACLLLSLTGVAAGQFLTSVN
jgi:hypothetical protein